jgi:hypothetical protein
MRIGLAFSVALCTAFPLSCQRTPATSVNANYYRMKKVSVVDEHGFERPMRALSLLVPSDWQFQGNVLFGQRPGCHADLAQVTFRAASPDGRLAVELFPSTHWQWADDPYSVRAMEAASQQAAMYGLKGCEIMPPMTPGDYLRRWVVPRFRPNAQVAAIEPMPEVAQQLQEKARRQEADFARLGMRVRIRAEVARARLEYSQNGQAVEEWLTAVTFAGAVPGPSFNMATGQMGQTLFYNCGAYLIFGLRALRGELQSREKFFTMVLSTVQVDPVWQGRVGQVIANMQATDAQGARDRSAIISRSNREISDIINRTYENRQRAQDASAEQFSQYIRGVETYRNPSTGETVDLSNQYGHAWVNGSNEYILSDSPGFNPNVVLRGNWTALERVKP